MPDNPTGSSQKPQKPQLDPYQEGIRKALQKGGEAHATEALASGVPPQHIAQQSGLTSPDDVLNQLLSLSQKQVPVAPSGSLLGPDKVGLLGALLNMSKGQGFNPMEQRTEPVGMTAASQAMGISQSMQKNQLDAQKFPFEISKLKADTEKAQMDVTQAAPEFKLGQLTKEEEIKSGFQVLTESRKEFTNKAIPQAYDLLNGLNNLERSAEELGDFQTGLAGQLKARGGFELNKFAKRPEVTQFVSDLKGILTPLARGEGLEKGVISDKDIERYSEQLSSPTTPLAQKKRIMNGIKAKVKDSLLQRAELAGVEESMIAQKYPRLYGKLAKIMPDAGDASGEKQATTKSKFKAGDRQKKGNVEYERQEDGTWIPIQPKP